MAANTDTVARILDGTLVALARRGVHKLSVSDVCAEAGISRGTLYRYFKSKEDLLEAIGGHVRDGLQQNLKMAVEARPDLNARVEVVVSAIVHYGKIHPEAAQVIVLEPGFGLDFVRAVFPEFVTITAELLTPALELSPAVRSGRLTSGELAELILRAAASTFFIPTDDLDDMPRVMGVLPCLHNVA